MKHTVSSHGRIDFLVNNGGGQFMSPLADVRKKGWDAVMDTNLNGTYYCLKHGKSLVQGLFQDFARGRGGQMSCEGGQVQSHTIQ